MKKTMMRWVQPGCLAAILAFWAFAPAAWSNGSLAVIAVAVAVTALIFGLEWVNERHASWRINKREFATDLFYFIFGYTVISWVSTKLAEDPMKAVKTSLGLTTDWVMHLPFVLQVALVIFLIEFGQYWMHRLMHKNSIFWLTHAPHHHITQLNAMKGSVGNPIELFLISLSVVALLDVPLAAVFCALNMLTAISTFAHANVRTYPPRWYAFLFTTIEHHSLHHSATYADSFCNYGNSLILLDRVFGTYRDGEAEAVGMGERIRLTIPEQFAFPFQPLIGKLRSRHTQNTSAET